MNLVPIILCTILTIHNCWAVELQTTELGTLIGTTAKTAWTSKTIYQFLGVRYGITPSGPRRFKPSKLANPWPGTHNVDKYGKPCPSIKTTLNMTAEQLVGDLEDCLHLSIYSKSISGKLPVMFFVYGNGFEDENPSKYPPNYLLEKDIVLVVPQYRTGPFGFLSTQTTDIPGNAALQDIILALNWTQSFIHYFGGDASKVTIFGHDTGASIVSALLISPTVPSGLFHRAIVQSGSILSTNTFDLNPVLNARDMAKFACNETDKIEDINQCFMKMNVTTLLQCYKKHFEKNSTTTGFPDLNGSKLTYSDLLPLPPYELMSRQSNIKDIPVMAGITKHDGSNVFAQVLQFLIANFGTHFDELNKSYNLDTIIEFLGLKDYTGTLSGFIANSLLKPNDMINGNITNVIDGLVDLCGVVTLKAPILKLIQAQAKYYPNQTYLYTFDYKGQFQYLQNQSYFGNYDGVHHFADIIHMFPHPNFGDHLNSDDKKMAKKLINLWTSFANNGIPVSEDVIFWPSVTKYVGPYLHINKVSTVGHNFLDEFSVAAHETQKSHCTKAKLSKVVIWPILILVAFKLF